MRNALRRDYAYYKRVMAQAQGERLLDVDALAEQRRAERKREAADMREAWCGLPDPNDVIDLIERSER